MKMSFIFLDIKQSIIKHDFASNISTTETSHSIKALPQTN